MEKGRGRKESFVEVKLHGNWSILESIALLKGFRLSPGLTKADIATIPQEAQSCGYNLEDSSLLRRGKDAKESRALK